MHIVVTGGAGFIGSHLVDSLLERPEDTVTVVDNLRRGTPAHLHQHHADPRLQVQIGDIRDPRLLDEAFSGAELVYHLAAQSNVMGSVSEPRYSFETNVVGTYNVLEAAVRRGVRRVVFSSSREVYGEPRGIPVDESHPLDAKNMYGASKAAGELYCQTFANQTDLDVAVLRFANVYGTRDSERVIPLWLKRATAGEPLLLYGGDQVLDFVSIGQVVVALVRAATMPADVGPINVGSGQGTTLSHLAARLRELCASTSPLQILPPRAVEVTRFVADVAKMRAILGITPGDDPLTELAQLVPGARVGAR